MLSHLFVHFLQEFFLGCEAGFDGGHTPRYHAEVYYEAGNRGRSSFHLAHNITRSVPSFHVHQLKPLTAYAIVAYASNSLGREEEDDDGFICKAYIATENIRFRDLFCLFPP